MSYPDPNQNPPPPGGQPPSLPPTGGQPQPPRDAPPPPPGGTPPPPPGGPQQPPPGGAPQPPPGYGAQPQPPGAPQQPPPPGYGPPPGHAQQPPPGHGPPPGYTGQARGVVPPTLDAAAYKTGLSIFLFIITFGIYGIYWSYRTNEDLKRYNGDGLGGGLAVVLHIFAVVVLFFTIPSEIEKMHQREGLQSPVKTIEGLWFFLPIIGMFIWYPKMQNALNNFWVSRGARPA